MKLKTPHTVLGCAFFVSIVLNVICLSRTFPANHLSVDYLGIIVGSLALITTALIGWQIYQVVFVEKRMVRIAKEAADDLSTELAEKSAKDTADKIVDKFQKDFGHDFGLLDKVYRFLMTAQVLHYFGLVLNPLDSLHWAFVYLRQIKSDPIRDSMIYNAQQLLLDILKYARQHGGERILLKRREDYRFSFSLCTKGKKEISSYLDKAVERDESYDNLFPRRTSGAPSNAQQQAGN